jgi:hypothetical protein
MPTWLVKLLEDGDGAAKIVSKLGTDGKLKKVRICPNMTSGIVPVLEQLLQQDRATEYAYLCDPAVKHVSKLKREGISISSVLKVREADECRWLLWIP